MEILIFSNLRKWKFGYFWNSLGRYLKFAFPLPVARSEQIKQSDWICPFGPIKMADDFRLVCWCGVGGEIALVVVVVKFADIDVDAAFVPGTGESRIWWFEWPAMAEPTAVESAMPRGERPAPIKNASERVSPAEKCFEIIILINY